MVYDKRLEISEASSIRKKSQNKGVDSDYDDEPRSGNVGTLEAAIKNRQQSTNGVGPSHCIHRHSGDYTDANEGIS